MIDSHRNQHGIVRHSDCDLFLRKGRAVKKEGKEEKDQYTNVRETPYAGPVRPFSRRWERRIHRFNEVCQLFCVNEQVLLLGMGCRGRG